MTAIAPFNPAYTKGQTVTPAAAAASITIDKVSKQCCLTNLGTNVCYIRIGNAPISATVADYPVLPGMQFIVTMADGQDTLSHISPAGTTLHVMSGEGF